MRPSLIMGTKPFAGALLLPSTTRGSMCGHPHVPSPLAEVKYVAGAGFGFGLPHVL